MIKSFIVKNYLNEILELELTNPQESGIAVRSVTGLGPGKSTVNIKEIASNDGGSFSGSRTPVRNIVMDLIFVDEYETIEDIRHKTYKYFPTKKQLTLTVVTDNHTLDIEGYVESNEPDIFSNMEGCQISILCINPFFHSKKEQITFSSGEEPIFEFPFSNELIENPVLPEDEEIITSVDINIPGNINASEIIRLDLDEDGSRKFNFLFYVDEFIIDKSKYQYGYRYTNYKVFIKAYYTTWENYTTYKYHTLFEIEVGDLSEGMTIITIPKKKYAVEISEKELFVMKERLLHSVFRYDKIYFDKYSRETWDTGYSGNSTAYYETLSLKNVRFVEKSKSVYEWGTSANISIKGGAISSDETTKTLNFADVQKYFDPKKDGNRMFILSFFIAVNMYRFETNNSSEYKNDEKLILDGFYTPLTMGEASVSFINNLLICELPKGRNNKKTSMRKYEVEISERMLWEMNNENITELNIFALQYDDNLGGNIQQNNLIKTELEIIDFVLSIGIGQSSSVSEIDTMIYGYQDDNLKVSPFYYPPSDFSLNGGEITVENKNGRIPFVAEVSGIGNVNLNMFQLSFPSENIFDENNNYYLTFLVDGVVNTDVLYPYDVTLFVGQETIDSNLPLGNLKKIFKKGFILRGGTPMFNNNISFLLTNDIINRIYNGNPLYIGVDDSSNEDAKKYLITIHDVKIVKRNIKIIDPSESDFLLDKSMPDHSFTKDDIKYNLQVSKGLLMGEVRKYYFNHYVDYKGSKSIGFQMRIEFINSLTGKISVIEGDQNEDLGYIIIKHNMYPEKKMIIDLNKISKILPHATKKENIPYQNDDLISTFELTRPDPPLVEVTGTAIPQVGQKGDIIFIDTRKKSKSVKYQKPNGIPDILKDYYWDYEDTKFNILPTLNRNVEWFEIVQGLNVFSICHTFYPEREELSDEEIKDCHANRLEVQIKNGIYYEGV